MARIPQLVEPSVAGKLVLKGETVGLSPEQFFRLSAENRDFRFEMTAGKEIVIMPPTGSDTGWRSSEILFQLTTWSKKDGTGLTFDSSTGFRLPNGAIRSPDAAWVQRRRWDALTAEERQGFAPLCPDFVVELRSPHDELENLQAKMDEYRAGGAALGLLIDASHRRVFVYRSGASPQRLTRPETVSCDPELPGLSFAFGEIW